MLRDTRQQRALSQQQLAHEAGVAIGTVRALEAGRTVEPGFFTVLELARALELSVTHLIDETSNATSEADVRVP